MNNPIYVLYHAQCNDGFGAAFAAYKKLGTSAVYIPCSYAQGDEPLNKLPDNATVYVVDFSFSREALMAADMRMNITVLDHHKSAEENLRGLEFCKFDMSKSGAVMAWEYFHPNKKLPLLFKHIQDRDLWQFKLPDTNAVHEALMIYEKQFYIWDQLEATYLIEQGNILLLKKEIEVKDSCKGYYMKEIGGHQVPTVNTRSYISDIGNALLDVCPDAPFSCVEFQYTDNDGRLLRKCSLRAREGGTDVSKIAQQYGGGGHAPAAGYVEVLDEV